MIYINWQGPDGRETIDALDPHAFKTYREMLKEARRLISEYALAGMGGAYSSSRACRGWNVPA